MGQDSTKLQSKRRIEDAEKVKLLSKENKATVKLSASEIQILKRLYHRLAALSPETEYIDKQTFLNYFPLEGVLAERLFATFDKDRNNVIDYEEFLGGLALCLCGSVDEKFKLIFDLYNIDDGDGISEDELAIVLKSTLMAATAIVTPLRNSPVDMPSQPSDIDKHVHNIVRDAFEECDTSQTGKLSPEEFRTWAERHSYILDIIFGHRSFTDKQKIAEHITAATIKAAEMNAVRFQAQTWVESPAIAEQNPETAFGYSKATYLWSPVFPVMLKAPRARSDHTVGVYQGSLYLLGGRGTSAYKDFWKYDLALNNWSEIPCTGERPSQIFGHSIVLHKGSMYVYGGEFASCETAVWKYTFACNEWKRISPPSAPCKKMLPGNCRHHTTVIYENKMYVFGGIIDMRGSTDNLWSFSFVNHEWDLISQTPKNNPGARYEHSAVVYNKAMWILGGLENYQAKSDLWKWNFENNSWNRIKTKGGPVAIHGHRAVKCGNTMIIFGGSVNGEQQNMIWKFEFETQSWSVITPRGGVSPPVRSAPAVFTLAAFSLPLLPPKLTNSKPKSASGVPQNIVAEELRPRSSPAVQCNKNISSVKTCSRPLSLSTDSLYQPTIPNCAYKRRSAGGSISYYDDNSAVTAFTNVSYSSSTDEAQFSKSGENTQPLQGSEVRPSEGHSYGRESNSKEEQWKHEQRDCMNIDTMACENFEIKSVLPQPKEGLCIFLVGGKYCGNHEFFTKAVDIWRCDVTKRQKRSNKVTKINVKTAGNPVAEATGNEESYLFNKTSCGETSVLLDTSNSPYTGTSRKVFASTCRQEASEGRNLAVNDDVSTKAADTYYGDLVITDLGYSNEHHLIEDDS